MVMATSWRVMALSSTSRFGIWAASSSTERRVIPGRIWRIDDDDDDDHDHDHGDDEDSDGDDGDDDCGTLDESDGNPPSHTEVRGWQVW